MISLHRISVIVLVAWLAACGGGGGGGDPAGGSSGSNGTGSAGGGTSTGGTSTGGTTGPSPSSGISIPVTGKVVNGADGTPVPGATIGWVVRPQQVADTTGSTSTGGDGTFGFTASPERRADSQAEAYVDVSVRAPGYVSTTLYAAPVNTGNGQLETIVLVRENTARGSISGTVRNARTGEGIAGIQLVLSDGQRDPVGAYARAMSTTTSDAEGGYTFTQLAAGTYTVGSATIEEFEPGRRTAIPVQSGTIAGQDLVLSPSSLTAGDIRVVLTWGQSPSDLDLHLTGPNVDASRFHISYASKLNPAGTPPAGAAVASLDRDDTTSYGPETITLSGRLNSGVYRFSIHDYTNRNTAASTALANSGARVELYTKGSASAQTFYVPNQPGNVWTVFELSGSDLVFPTVTAVNTMGYTQDPSTILGRPLREAAVGGGEAAAIGGMGERCVKWCCMSGRSGE